MRLSPPISLLAIVIGVALLGCQADSSAPLGSDTESIPPRFGHKPTHTGRGDGPFNPNFQVEITGDVNGSGDTTVGNFDFVDIGTFLQARVTDGGTCFPNAGYTGNLSASQVEDGTVTLRFAFNALNNKGSDARYTFFGLGGVVTSGIWPPDGNGTTVVFSQWSLAKGGRGGAAACSGGGAFSATMTAGELL